MLCTVYKIRENGARTNKVGHPVIGDLVLFKWEDGTNRLYRLRAELHAPDGRSVLPVLDFAQVVKITERGIVINGLEMIAKGRKGPIDRQKQTWWCKFAVTCGRQTSEPSAGG